MQKTNVKSENNFRRFAKRTVVWVMLFAMIVQIAAVTCSAAIGNVSSVFGNGSGNSNKVDSGSIVNGIGKFESDEVIKQLRKDFLHQINQDLIHSIDEYELRGEVGAIISFSDASIVNSFNSLGEKDMTFDEYRVTSEAISLKDKLYSNQTSVLNHLKETGLITEVKYNYFNIMDGAYVRTSYENIEGICNVEGVERVMISNTYEPMIAVDNPVDVYETGIFNSSDISFTGKGTIVAILDTGCDYTHSAFTTHVVESPLYDRDDIAGFLTDLKAYEYDNSIEVRELYYGNITNGKIAFGYDYADKDTNIMPFSESHGTHVAGIIGGYDDTITGVAIDTQFAIMKVFSDYEPGAEDGDILAALEDAVTLGVDAINMSLGSSCGFSREVDEEEKNVIYDSIEAAGISLIVAASNDYSSGFGSEHGNTNKTDNPDSATVGSPATYGAAFSVASINGNKENYMFVNGDREVFFNESYNMNSKKYNFFEMLGVTAENPIVELDYVTVPGNGYAINYSGIDVEGKIALIRRGDITFEEKVQYAQEAGAVAAIIYNNIFGEISMTVGNHIKIPVISISKDDGDVMAATEGGKVVFNFANEAGPFMSDFSSWGPTPDLKLKPEITAHGGNILSAIVGGEYEELSGTSMAAPNMAGITVLIRQYVKEKYPEMSATEVRDLVNRLCMSTATITLDMKGNPYSPRKQGAGIADIAKATTTPAYLWVDGINKTKLELGDDPTRSGVYKMNINLTNISDADVSYRLGNIAMTESISTSEPEFVAEMAYLLSNSAKYEVDEGGTLADGVVTVGAGKTAKVTVTLTLSAKDKSYLNSTFANGMFVEGFLTFENTDEKGVDLNAPFLAFYGDWGEAPIFDLDYYEVETEAHNNAIDDEDKIKADYYATTPLGSYYYDYLLPLGTYLWKMDEEKYSAIPAIEEHAAVSYYVDAISGIYGVYTGLLRGAKELNISIVDTSTGKEVWSLTEYNCYKAHFGGVPYPYISRFDLPMINTETGTVFGVNNAHYEVTMSAKLDWDSENRNSLDTYSFSFYIDYEAPSVTKAEFRTEYDKGREENRYYADIYVYDNHYAMSLRPVVIYDYTDEDGEEDKTYASLTEYPIPVYQQNRGEVTKVTVEITDYIDIIANSDNPAGLTVYIDDYAMNPSIAYIPFPETDNTELEFMTDEITLNINDTFDLYSYLVKKDSTETFENNYLKNLTWSTSNEAVVAVGNGQVEARKSGSAVIKVTADSWIDKQGNQIYKSIIVNVSDTESDKKLSVEELDFTSYYTIFAFNSDIDYSEIGLTDTYGYFDGNAHLSCYPSEQVKLFYDLKPWYLTEDEYELKWTSSNPKVATVDDKGVVTAESEGSARITLQIKIGDKTSLIAARCSIEVKSEFIIENRTLVAYKGKGGEVVIPDDEGILYIGAFAFSHFDLDNEKEVEKDENGYYDFDEKKTPIGNKTVTSVIIPDSVEGIEKYAFYNCEVLRDVTLPDTCKSIGSYAFAYCPVLENVNFKDVNIIANYAFYKCSSLSCDKLGGANLSETYAIGEYAFAEARFTELKLSNLSLTGKGAFADCSKLEKVELGTKTRIAECMFENTPIKEVVIYSDIVSNSAFKNCKKLTSVTFKNDLTYLGKEAFIECTALKNVSFEAACEEIAEKAFFKCTSLKELTLPNCDFMIGDSAFAESGLTKVIFAENSVISKTGISIFDKIRSLSADVTASANYKMIGDVLYTKDESCLVLLLPGSPMQEIVVPASVKKIADGAFASNLYLKTVTFAEGSVLEYIGNSAFSNCAALSSVTLPDRAVVIGDKAFYNSQVFKNINLNKVTSVGESAFTQTALSSVELETEGVVIGNEAFYIIPTLTKATIGKGAEIGRFAFGETGLRSVDFLGNGVTVGEGAFAACTYLTKVDFADISGVLANFAFALCVSLETVDMPNVTEIGYGAFADCYSLVNFSAANLVVIGDAAFSPRFNEEATQGAAFKTINTPKVEKIGIEAFYLCLNLESIDLTGVTEVGAAAFAECSALTEVTLTESLKHISDYLFLECTSLANIDLSHAESFGFAPFYGVQLPAELNLENAKTIGEQTFFEGDDDDSVHYLESVYAPNVTSIGSYAFIQCKNLKSFYAPKVEEIGDLAFAYTGIEEFEISSALKSVGSGSFDDSANFKGFFVTDNGEKKTTAEFENVMIKDGVLYSIAPKGYVLEIYPMAKEDKEYTVAENTIRIEFGAAFGNKYIEKVILPSSVRHIGNLAFYGCEALKTVVFNSYYAPVLEGTWSSDPETGELPVITPDNIDKYPGFDKLYKYNFYYRVEDEVSPMMYYSNFKGLVTSEMADGLVCVIPENSSGYDSILYNAFFTVSDTENTGKVMGSFAIDFIDAVNRLPETADRFDKKFIDAAINAYNALVDKTEEMAFVDASYIEKYNKACSEYNVSVTENLIAHLFDMDNSKYSFDIVKAARESYLALSDSEKALVSNASVLDEKVAALKAAMGVDIDFSKNYEDNLPKEEPPVEEPPVDEPPVEKDDSWKIIVIIVCAVVVLAGIAVAVVVFLKKKKSANANGEAVVNEASAESDVEEISENTDADCAEVAASDDENSVEEASDTKTEE